MTPEKTKKYIKLLIGFLVLAVIIVLLALAGNTSSDRTNISKPEKMLREILAPLQNGASVVSQKLQGIPLYFGGIDKLQEENQALQEQVDDLQGKIVASEEIEQENQRLKELLNMAENLADQFDYVGTTVINRSQSTWYKTMIINGGEDQGFATGMPVAAAGGLVGRIINVSAHTSEVLLILDREGAVGAMIQDTRTVGIVEGVDSESDTMSMIHIPYDAQIEKYQKVITSGLGGVYPKGLIIGFVKEVEMESGGLMMKATVQSFVDFDKLEEVLVLRPKGSQ